MSTEQASSRHIGPYRLITELGRGGMGIVHRAEHADSGECVAVKTVAVATRKAISALREEVLALKRISHPCVVRIVAEGLDEGLPWYAMELVEGRSLADVNDEIWGRRSGGYLELASETRDKTSYTHDTFGQPQAAAPIAERRGVAAVVEAANGRLPEVIELYERICWALSYIHGQGIVHRDLKPNNIFVRPDGSPVLMDFGLVSRAFGSLGRESIGLGEHLIGTLSYASPEQLWGHPVDARADLYSLGCMLFESVTGAPPSPGRSARTLLQSRLTEPIVPPSELVDCPKELDELIVRLLAKSVRERLGSARDVAAELSFLLGRSQRTSEPGEDAQVYLYRPGISGRDAVLAKLTECRKRARNGRGSLVLVGGESGIGKTFLAAEVVREAALEQFQVVTGECTPVTTGDMGGPEVNGAPLHPFRSLFQAMADRCHEEGEAFTHWLFGKHSRLLASYEPALAQLPGSDRAPEPSPLVPAAAQRRLITVLTETLGRFAEVRPLLLVVDDLQWADELSLRFLSALNPEYLQRRSLIVLGTYRSDEPTEALHQVLAQKDLLNIVLDRLDEATIAAIVSDMLGVPSVPPGLVHFLAQRSEGNPFFVAEYLRTAAAERLLSRKAGRWTMPVEDDPSLPAYEALPLPVSIKGLVLQRLQGLDEEAREAADAAAVLGREFELEVLSRTLRADDGNIGRVVETLRRRQILETSTGGALRFVHDRLREAAYERILPERRRLLHRSAAQAVERRYASTDEVFSQHAVLARHWSMAQVPAHACDHFQRAADRARAAFAHDEAVMFYNAAIQEARQGIFIEGHREDFWRERLCTLHEFLADLQARSGKQTDARSSLDAADKYLRADAAIPRSRILRKLSKTEELQHRYDEALAFLDSAQSELEARPANEEESQDWWREWLDIQNHRIWVYYWTGDVRRMTDTIETARGVLNAHGTRAQQAHFYQLFSLLRMRSERFALSTETVELARRAFDAVQGGEATEVPAVHFTYGFALLFNDQTLAAQRVLQETHTLAERVGDVAVQCRALTYLLIVQRRRRLEEEVLHTADKTMQLASAAQMRHYIGAAQASLGWLALRRGDLPVARELCEAGIESWNGAMPSSFPFRWMALWPMLALPTLEPDSIDTLARALLDESQQRLPQELEAHVRATLSAPLAEKRSSLAHALQLATSLGYI
ncbi:MAG: serine/threonine-protein kinase PknK [Myxococcales bacterium]|nr:MAG: serine/threonine-protein kinase PknK [Myxococcales bacterium]